MKIAGLLLLLTSVVASANAQWIKQTVNTTASFRGLSVVNEKVIWASGTGGTVIRTIDGGKKWDVIQVPDAAKLDFRDIEAFDANSAYILSIGNGDSSRIYKTIDGGKTWKLQFKNTNEKAFFDAISCWDRNSCVVLSDPIDKHFLLIRTLDGGTSWSSDEKALGTILAEEGEAAFAASGTCVLGSPWHLMFVTGGKAARVLSGRSPIEGGGFSWSVSNTSFASGTSGSGIFSLAMFDSMNGVIVGGNYEKPNEATDNLGLLNGGGAWKISKGLTGYRSGVTYADKNTIIAVGTNGSDISRDGGITWLRIDGENYNSVQAKGKNAIWAAGPKGYVARLSWQDFLAFNAYKTCPKNAICEAISVEDLRLSHGEISPACVKSDSHCSDKKQIEVAALAPNIAPNWYDYNVSAGQIVGFGPNVQWDLSDVKPGTYAITVGIKMPSGDAVKVLGKTITKQVTVK